jgi:hypothetical protein
MPVVRLPPPASAAAAVILLCGVVLISGSVYFAALDVSPPHVSSDEAQFAVHARALAATGRDDNGTTLPLFFHLTDPVRPERRTDAWWQPMLFYAMAGALQLAPLSVTAIRAVVVAVALIDIVLIYAVARQWFGSHWYGLLAAVLLALTPAHFLLGRQATDYFLPLPFVLVWLYALPRCVRSDGRWAPALAGVALGVGLYSYITSWVVMPVLLLITHALLWRAGAPRTAHVTLAAGFAAALLPLGPWLLTQPGMVSDIFSNYHVTTESRLFRRIEIYWQYCSPSYLLFSGGSDYKWATREAGVFAQAFGVLLPLGIHSVFRKDRASLRRVLAFGFLLAPVPIIATLPEAPGPVVAREMIVVPFGVLLAVAGVERLVSRGRYGFAIAALLLLMIPVQFNTFVRHYFGDYKAAAGPRFDELNLQAVADEVIAMDTAAPVPGVYFSLDTSAAQATQWRFHLLLRDRLDLWSRTHVLDLSDFCTSDVPPGSVLVMKVGGGAALGQAPGQECLEVKVIGHVGGAPASKLVRRQ